MAVGVGVDVGVAVGVALGVGVGFGVAVGLGLGVGVGVGDGTGEALAIGPIYWVAITTLSYHFLFRRPLCAAWRPIWASSILSVLTERTFKFGKSLISLPSIQYLTSPSFCPGVFTRTMSS